MADISDERKGYHGGNGDDDRRNRDLYRREDDYYRERGRGGHYDDRRGGYDRYNDYGRRGGGGGYSHDDYHDRRADFRRGPPHREHRRGRNPSNRSGIYFHSMEEERAWVEERRRKRKERPSSFDVEPTEEQMAMEELQKAALATSGVHPGVFSKPAAENAAKLGRTSLTMGKIESARCTVVEDGKDYNDERSSRSYDSGNYNHQQTRHARRLYIGHLPSDLMEEEVHIFFRDAIFTALGEEKSELEEDDPILSVYINKDRRFAFVEFKSVDICSACLVLDGIDVCGKGKVKVKRPNDYQPALAPPPSSKNIDFDVSKLGIVSGTVPDSKNKIFIGGLPYHLNEEQVMELLGAFGKIKAFHLVKADATATTSKGYCFVEYTDNVKDVAIMGLNGMDMGGGKVLSARIASSRNEEVGQDGTRSNKNGMGISIPGLGQVAPIVPSASGTSGTISSSATHPIMRYVDGVDIEALVDVAMGITSSSHSATPTVTTTSNPTAASGLQGQSNGNYYGPAGGATPAVKLKQQPASSSPSKVNGTSNGVLDIANAALEAAYGQTDHSNQPPKTRILVLHNMVTDEDLETTEDFEGLKEEVGEECKKFGTLVSMKIPRQQDKYPSSAVRKIFLEYSSLKDAMNAEQELSGRQFGPATVAVTFFSETGYVNDQLQ